MEVAELFQAQQLLLQNEIPIHGVRDGGAVVIPDFKEEATEGQRALAAQLLEDWEFVPDPQWDAFVAAFQTPGNTFYLSVASKVAAAGFLAQDHFQNFKLLIATPNLRSVEMLALSVAHLQEILAEAEHPLSTADVSGWNALMSEYDFPESCQL